MIPVDIALTGERKTTLTEIQFLVLEIVADTVPVRGNVDAIIIRRVVLVVTSNELVHQRIVNLPENDITDIVNRMSKPIRRETSATPNALVLVSVILTISHKKAENWYQFGEYAHATECI